MMIYISFRDLGLFFAQLPDPYNWRVPSQDQDKELHKLTLHRASNGNNDGCEKTFSSLLQFKGSICL